MSTEEKIAGLLAEHGYRDVRGDYETAPYYMHIGCTCGWQQDIGGMSGWRSWLDAHTAHVAAVLVEAGIGDVDQAYAEWLERGEVIHALRERMAKVEALADGWAAKSARYIRYAEGSVIANLHHMVGKTLADNATELRAALGEQP
ncbi:hypothetical protein [Nocardioides jensenii]|uniref:hypothetical protein n=1 Tax=Nocardioides jensenii TaxID=1843 RepID=UPI0008324805|nr:hypothetical protein [Nocardioides jensenii]